MCFSDGWTLDLLQDDIDALVNRKSLSPRPPFANIVSAWRDRPNTPKNFWKQYLKDAPSLAWPEVTDSSASLSTTSCETAVWSSEHLSTFCAEKRTTLALVTRLASALALARCASSSDVLFGIIRSGRDCDVDNAERIIGPCVSLLPCRMTFAPSHQTSTEALANEAAQDQSCRRAQLITPADLQSSLDRRPYDVLLTFQSLAHARATQRVVSEPPLSIRMPTNYKISIEITPTNPNQITFHCYHSAGVSQKDVTLLLRSITDALDFIISDPEDKLSNYFGAEFTSRVQQTRPASDGRARRGEDRAEDDDTNLSELEASIRTCWSEALRMEPGELTRSSRFTDVGGDSVRNTASD